MEVVCSSNDDVSLYHILLGISKIPWHSKRYENDPHLLVAVGYSQIVALPQWIRAISISILFYVAFKGPISQVGHLPWGWLHRDGDKDIKFKL